MKRASTNFGYSLLELIIGIAVATIGVFAVNKLIDIKQAQEKSLEQRSQFSDFRLYLSKKLDCQATLGFNREKCNENDGYLRLMISRKDGTTKPLGDELLDAKHGPVAYSHRVKNYFVRARCEENFVRIAAAQYDKDKHKFAYDPINKEPLDFDHPKSQVFGDSAMICSNASDVPEGGDVEGTYGAFQKHVFTNTEDQPTTDIFPLIYMRSGSTDYVHEPTVILRGSITPKGDMVSIDSYATLMAAANNASLSFYYQIEREGKPAQQIQLGKYDGDKTSISFAVSHERLIPVNPGETIMVKLMVDYKNYMDIEPCGETNKCSTIRTHLQHHLILTDYFNQ